MIWMSEAYCVSRNDRAKMSQQKVVVEKSAGIPMLQSRVWPTGSCACSFFAFPIGLRQNAGIVSIL